MATPFQIPGLSTSGQPAGPTHQVADNSQNTTADVASAPVVADDTAAVISGESNNSAEQIHVPATSVTQPAEQEVGASTVNEVAMDIDGHNTKEVIAEATTTTGTTDAPTNPPSLTEDLEALIGGLDPVPAQTDSANVQTTDQNAAEENSEMRDADAPGENDEEGAGWEADSSPYESSSDSSSSDDSDDDSDDDNELLKPEEMARILMEAASDDEGEGKAKGSGSGGLRTKNELAEDVTPRPDITITPEMQIHALGEVEHVVENTILIKAYTNGEYQVLDSGSVLCTEDRTVVAALADLIGSVREPRYMARFQDAEELKSFKIEVGTKIFYTMEHSTFVFTQPLKAMKGTDASNLNDEELEDDDMEFSDDEKESEFKKAKRNARSNARGGADGTRGGRGGRGGRHDAAPAPTTLQYDDDDDGPYRPLARPANFGQGAAVPAFTAGSSANHDGGSYRGGRGGRGRGRGHTGRGNRGGQRHHGSGAGYSQQSAPQGYPQQQQQQSAPQPYSQQQQQQQQLPFFPPPPNLGAAQGFVPPPPPQFGGQAPFQFPTWPQTHNMPANFVPPPPPQFQQPGQGAQPYFPPAFLAAMQGQAQYGQNHGNQQNPGQFPPPNGSG